MTYGTKSLIVFLLYFGQWTSVAAVDFEFSGFGSIAGGKLNTNDVDLGDYTDKLSFNNDSVLGLQLETAFSPLTTLTSQLLMRGYIKNQYNNYKPQVEWFYLTHQLNSAFKVRGGRLRLPSFMASEYLEVGMAYNWIRPPTDVYPIINAPFSTYDGLGLVYTATHGDYDLTSQAIAGTYKNSTAIYDFKYSIDANWVAGANIDIERHHWRFRAVYLIHNIDIISAAYDELKTLFVDSASPDNKAYFATMVDGLPLKAESHRYVGIGVEYRDNHWLLQSELTTVQASHISSTDLKGAYATGSYRFGKLIPYITFGYYRAKTDAAMKALFENSISLEPNNTTLNDYLLISTQRLTATYSQVSQALGARYDINDNMTTKIELLRIEPRKDLWGQFEFNENTSSAKPHPVKLLSFSFDFLF